MSNSDFKRNVDLLLEKYAELLTGESNPEIVEKVKIYALYSHISKTMPPLVNHWNQSHPDSKEEIRKLFEEIRDLNLANKEKNKKQE